MKKILALFLALAMTFALVACGDKTSDDGQAPSNDDNNTETTTGGTIRIGIAAPLTGTSAAYGELMVDGAQIAIDEVNANGGVNGKMLELVEMDDKNDPSEAALVAGVSAMMIPSLLLSRTAVPLTPSLALPSMRLPACRSSARPPITLL